MPINVSLLVPETEYEEYIEWIERFAHPDLRLLPDAGPETEVALGTTAGIIADLPNMPNLKWAQSTWAGVEAFTKITDPWFTLTNARGIFGHLMAEYVFGYLLLIEKDMLKKHEDQRLGQWNPTITGNIRGKTMAILGVGSIGSQIARTAKFFGLKTKGFTLSSESCADIDIYSHTLPLSKFVSDVDYLVNVLPNTAATKDLIDMSVFNSLPREAIVINAGRGFSLDEYALSKALDNGYIRAAVLDVFKEEPLPKDSPLWQAKNCFITSHTSAHTFIDDIFPIFTRNFEAYAENRPLINVVDMSKGY